MFKEILAVLLLIHMTMSAPAPEPKPEEICTSTGCTYITYCSGGKCVGRKRREAEPESSPEEYVINHPGSAQWSDENGCTTTCDMNGCRTFCRSVPY